MLAVVLLLSTVQLAPQEQSVLSALDPTRVISLTRRLSEEIIDNRSGAGAGSAIAGSADEKALADAIEKEMVAIGLEVSRERFPVRLYEYGEVTLSANGEPIPAITLHSTMGTWGVKDDIPYARGNAGEDRRLAAVLADAGEGLAAHYDRIGAVRGKIVLVRRTLWPSYPILEAAERGASAVLFYDYPGDNPDDTLKQDGVQYHDPIPAVSITRSDALRLKEALSRGEVDITLENRVDIGYGVSENVIGRLEGADVPDEYVAVTAHHDRWHKGAQDDAVGVAVLLELARVIHAAEPRRRTHLFISFGAEEAGGIETQYDWLTGSYAFAKDHPEVTSRLAYAFNVDGAGWSQDRGHLFATIDNLPFQRELLSDLGLSDRIEIHEGVTNWVDAWSLGGIGGGAVSYLLWFSGHPAYENERSFSRYYHTQLDLYRPRDYQNLDVDLELGVLGLLRADAAVVIPIALTEVASWASKAIEADAARAPEVSFEEARSAALVFHREAERVQAATRSARLVNRALLNARHHLVPWLLTGSSSRAVLKTTPYAADLETLRRAREAAEFGDAAMAARALEEVSSMEAGKLFSESTYLRERLFAFGPANWGNDFEQDQRLVSASVHRLHRRLKSEGTDEKAVGELRGLEAQARGFLEEALLIVSGKLREAAVALREAPLP